MGRPHFVYPFFVDGHLGCSTFWWLWILTSSFASQRSWSTFSCFSKLFCIFSFILNCLFRSLPYFLFWCSTFPFWPVCTLWASVTEFLQFYIILPSWFLNLICDMDFQVLTFLCLCNQVSYPFIFCLLMFGFSWVRHLSPPMITKIFSCVALCEVQKRSLSLLWTLPPSLHQKLFSLKAPDLNISWGI